LGLSGPVPARVDGAVKDKLLAIIGECVAAGWSMSRVCSVLEVDRRRVWRWQARRATGVDLGDRVGGGNPIHGLLGWEIDEVLGALRLSSPRRVHLEMTQC